MNSLAFVLPVVGGIAGVSLDNLEGDYFTDMAGNVNVSKIFNDAMAKEEDAVNNLVNNDQDDSDSDEAWGYLGRDFHRMDRPWNPPNNDLQPRPRRHPRPRLPRAGSGSESSDSSSDSVDSDASDAENLRMIETHRLLKQPVKKGTAAHITENQQRAIITKLRSWGWLSDAMLALDPIGQRELLHTDLEATKWKTLKMVREYGPDERGTKSFVPPLVKLEITGM